MSYLSSYLNPDDVIAEQSQIIVDQAKKIEELEELEAPPSRMVNQEALDEEFQSGYNFALIDVMDQLFMMQLGREGNHE